MDDNQRTNPIGKTSSPFREPNTTKVFYFWLKAGISLDPLGDIVAAEQPDGSLTTAIVDEVFAYTDADSHLTNYISSEIGDPSAEPYVDRVSAMVAQANVLRNVRNDDAKEVYMPLPADRMVFFADEEATRNALGYDRILGTPIPAGHDHAKHRT